MPVPDETRTPNLAEIINRALAAFGESLHVALPCVVQSYDDTKGTVNVVPKVGAQYVDQNGQQQNEDLPVLVDLPVHFPGGGGFRVKFPIQAGDTGMAMFCDRSIDAWLASKGDQSTYPYDARQHHIADGFFVPGIRPQGVALAAGHTGTVSIGQDGASSDFAALASKVLTQLQNIVTALNNAVTVFNAHTHLVSAFGSPSSPPAVPQNPAGNPSSVASATVEILG